MSLVMLVTEEVTMTLATVGAFVGAFVGARYVLRRRGRRKA